MKRFLAFVFAVLMLSCVLQPASHCYAARADNQQRSIPLRIVFMPSPKSAKPAVRVTPLWLTKIDPTNWDAFFDTRYDVRGSRIYYLQWGRLVCAELKTGHEVWSVGSGLKPPLVFGSRTIFVGGTGAIVAFDAVTGSLLWSHRELKTYVPNMLFLNAKQLFSSGGTFAEKRDSDNGWFFEVLDSNTGRLIWRQPAPGTPIGPPMIERGLVLQSYLTSGAIMGAHLFFYDLLSGNTLENDSNWLSRPLARVNGRVVAVSSWPGDAESHHPLTLGYISLYTRVAIEERLFAPDLGAIPNAPSAEDYWASGTDLFLAVDGYIYRYNLLVPPGKQHPLMIVGPQTPQMSANYAGRTNQALQRSVPRQPAGSIQGPFANLMFLHAPSGLWRLSFVGRDSAEVMRLSTSASEPSQIVVTHDRLVVASEDGSIVAYTLNGKLMSVANSLACSRFDHLVVFDRVAVASCPVDRSDEPYRMIVVPMR